MSQATLERPAARKSAAKPAAVATNPREKIAAMFSELLQGTLAVVESEEGDYLGRVFETAAGIVNGAYQQFAAGDAEPSYSNMLDAESLMRAAAALAEREYQENNQPRARWTEAQRLADLSDALTSAQDQYVTDINSDKAQGQHPQEAQAVAPADAPEPAADVDDPEVTLTREAAHLITNCTYQIETCILMMQDMARRSDDETTGVHLPVVVQALGVRIEQLNQCITDTIYPKHAPSPQEIRDKVEGQAPRLMQIKQPA